jgi:hypothetical protein
LAAQPSEQIRPDADRVHVHGGLEVAGGDEDAVGVRDAVGVGGGDDDCVRVAVMQGSKM